MSNLVDTNAPHVIAYDEKGEELWRRDYSRGVDPGIATTDQIQGSAQDVDQAHKIVTSDGRVLKDRSGPKTLHGIDFVKADIARAARERALAEKEAAHEPPADAVGLVTAVGHAPNKPISKLAFKDREREEARLHTPEYVGDPEVVEVVEATADIQLDLLSPEAQAASSLGIKPYADKRTEFITKDSGEREVFASGMVRDVRTGKGRWDLIPMEGMARVAGLYERGAVKYGPRNWEKGSELSRYMDSLLRHAFQASAGMTDEDHLAGVAWNALAIMDHQAKIARGELPSELDDLPNAR